MQCNRAAAVVAFTLVTAPLQAQDLSNIMATMTSHIAGETNTVMTLGFTTPVVLPVGTTVEASLGTFGSGIAAAPTLTRVSGWGVSTITVAAYSPSTSALSFQISTAAIPANQSVSFTVNVSQNPPAGTLHQISMKTSESPSFVDGPELGFGPMPVDLSHFEVE